MSNLTLHLSRFFTSKQRSHALPSHWGNVLSIVSDSRKAIDDNNDNVVEKVNAHITSTNDYYPFGMVMQGHFRKSYNETSEEYLYGFNSLSRSLVGRMEHDKEVIYGKTAYTTEFRAMYILEHNFGKIGHNGQYQPFWNVITVTR